MKNCKECNRELEESNKGDLCISCAESTNHGRGRKAFWGILGTLAVAVITVILTGKPPRGGGA